LCDLRDAIGNAEPVQRPKAERLEHQKIECTLQKIVLRLLHYLSYRQSIQDRYQCSYRMSIRAMPQKAQKHKTEFPFLPFVLFVANANLACEMTPKPQPEIRTITRLVPPSGNLVQGQSELAINPQLAQAAEELIKSS